MMTAVVDDDKWQITREVARRLGYGEHRIAKWRSRRRVSPMVIVPLVMASKGKLKLADFTEIMIANE